ncbi:transcriptional regulator [Bacillus australimaris]|uniref:Helix-turn-helix domain-containing protein n=1 Tax=Bacillus australimaris TaxID=1326968 RepID=A0ABD4QNC9_9BACI|nr:helix-turn-helix domain-containing protein [Bacillus australimaris]KPN12684.1 transcriptional regulator [Bacillus australimaris]MBR8691626.1 helix-turn-helix domain-containing protein [Bacillus australimaris]
MDLIDNKSKRWINILKLLVSKNKWWTLQEISDEKIGSVRAIQSDLEQMKSFQTENGEPLIRIKPRQGISICYTQTIRVDYYIKEILKDTIEIRLIDGIFFEENMTFYEWMDTLNISRSTLYNTIHKINSILTSYDIELRPDSMQFHGNEKEIRQFFVEFLFEVYGSRLWPFNEIQKQDAVDLLQELFQVIEVNVPDIAIDKYCLWLGVSIHRIRKNFTIRRNYTYSMNEEKQTAAGKSIYGQIKAWEKHIGRMTKNIFDITLDHHEFVFLLLIEPAIGHFKSIESVEEKLMFFQSHTPRLFDAIQKFINQLELIFHQEVANRKVLTLLLLQYYVYSNEITGRDGFLFKKKSRYLSEVKKQLPYFYSRITHIIQELKTDDILASFVKNERELIRIITSNWRGLVHLEMERRNVLNIFVISTLGYNHSLFIADLIKLSLPPLIHIFTSPENTLNALTMDRLGIDMIVTDTELPHQFGRSTLLINSFPTKKELDNLHRRIVDIND